MSNLKDLMVMAKAKHNCREPADNRRDAWNVGVPTIVHVAGLWTPKGTEPILRCKP